MKTAVKPDLKSKTFFTRKSFSCLKKKEVDYINFKFYQNLFVVLVSLSTILIFPESPVQLGNICESYNSRKICNVW